MAKFSLELDKIEKDEKECIIVLEDNPEDKKNPIIFDDDDYGYNCFFKTKRHNYLHSGNGLH